ncbi:MAG: PilZ domain-containing protein [Bradymonadia bacterium]|jgi:hypothetical protein
MKTEPTLRNGRNETRKPLDIYVNKMINGVPHLARTRNISPRGVFLHRLLEPRTPAKARIALELVLPGCDEVLWLDAEIVHGRNTRRGVGLRFVDLSPRDEALIQGYLDAAAAA